MMARMVAEILSSHVDGKALLALQILVDSRKFLHIMRLRIFSFSLPSPLSMSKRSWLAVGCREAKRIKRLIFYWSVNYYFLEEIGTIVWWVHYSMTCRIAATLINKNIHLINWENHGINHILRHMSKLAVSKKYWSSVCFQTRV